MKHNPMDCVNDKRFAAIIENPSTPEEHTYMTRRAAQYHREMAMTNVFLDSGQCQPERFPDVEFDSDEFILDDVNVMECFHDETNTLYHVYYSCADHVSFDIRMTFQIEATK